MWAEAREDHKSKDHKSKDRKSKDRKSKDRSYRIPVTLCGDRPHGRRRLTSRAPRAGAPHHVVGMGGEDAGTEQREPHRNNLNHHVEPDLKRPATQRIHVTASKPAQSTTPGKRADFRNRLRHSCNARWRRCAELGQRRGMIAAMPADFGRRCRKGVARVDGVARAEATAVRAPPRRRSPLHAAPLLLSGSQAYVIRLLDSLSGPWSLPTRRARAGPRLPDRARRPLRRSVVTLPLPESSHEEAGR